LKKQNLFPLAQPCASVGLALLLISGAASAQADTDRIQELEDRIDSLEDQLLDVDERVGTRAVVHAFDALQMDFGGFATQRVNAVKSDAHTRAAFDMGQFELFLKAIIDDDWEFFSILEFKRVASLNESDTKDVQFGSIANKADLELYWFNYRLADSLQFRAGRFIAEHGIINVEHFQPTLLHLDYPMFMRKKPGSGSNNSGSLSFFERFMVGAMAHGQTSVGDDNSLVYNAYIGTDKQNGMDYQSGARAALSWGHSGLTTGLNFGHGNHGAVVNGNSYDFWGVDLLYDKDAILWKNELYASKEDVGTEDRLGWYTQPAVRLADKWIAFYRYDFLDNADLGKGDQTEHVVGINYLPNPLVRLRATATQASFDLPDDDFTSFQLSATISF